MDFQLMPDDRKKANHLASQDCFRCGGTGVVVTHDDFGLADPNARFSVEDFCDCTEKHPEHPEPYNWRHDCKLCLGEGLIRGIDFGDGPGNREYVWDICDCDAGRQIQFDKFEF